MNLRATQLRVRALRLTLGPLISAARFDEPLHKALLEARDALNRAEEITAARLVEPTGVGWP